MVEEGYQRWRQNDCSDGIEELELVIYNPLIQANSKGNEFDRVPNLKQVKVRYADSLDLKAIM
jgi:hypothetical protein